MSLKILLVEDDLPQRKALRRLLEADGYLVVDTDNAEDAIRLGNTDYFHVALLDWELRQSKKGTDVAAELPSRMHKFMITGHTLAEMRKNWRDPMQGILEVFEKPVDYDGTGSSRSTPKTCLRARLARIEKGLEDTKP